MNAKWDELHESGDFILQTSFVASKAQSQDAPPDDVPTPEHLMPRCMNDTLQV